MFSHTSLGRRDAGMSLDARSNGHPPVRKTTSLRVNWGSTLSCTTSGPRRPTRPINAPPRGPYSGSWTSTCTGRPLSVNDPATASSPGLACNQL